MSLRLSASSLPHTQVENTRQPSDCNIDVLQQSACQTCRGSPEAPAAVWRDGGPGQEERWAHFTKQSMGLFTSTAAQTPGFTALQLYSSGKAGILQVPVCKTALCCLQNWRMLRRGRSSWRIAVSWRRASAVPPRPGSRRSCPTGLQCEYKHQLLVEFQRHTCVSWPSYHCSEGSGISKEASCISSLHYAYISTRCIMQWSHKCRTISSCWPTVLCVSWVFTHVCAFHFKEENRLRFITILQRAPKSTCDKI